MDARLDPAQILGIELGSAHVIRNAGGRAADALRSIIISQQLLGTREIVIIHHVSLPHSSHHFLYTNKI
jgi:carbonic anhydrase